MKTALPQIGLSELDFQPLSWVKARLSAVVKDLPARQKKIVLTTNGRPTAVLISYEDFLRLFSRTEPDADPIRFEDWKRERKNKEKIRDSIVELFDISKLTRKGQKKYKEESVRAFDR